MSSAGQELIDLLNAQNVTEESLYDWCAQHCVFRGDRRPQSGGDGMPLVNYFGLVSMVRHAYMSEGKPHLVLIGDSGAVSLSDYTEEKAEIEALGLGDTEAKSIFDLTFGKRLAFHPLQGMDNSSLIMVGDAKAPVPQVGALGNKHLPPPNYRVVGTIVTGVSTGASTVRVRVYVRGHHFVEVPEEIDIPFNGFDKFFTVVNPRDRGPISSAIQKAAANLAGLKNLPKMDGNVTVSAKGEITLKSGGDSYANMEALYTALGSARNTAEGKAYLNATSQPLLYTYALANERSKAAMDAIIVSLEKAHPNTQDIREAAEDLSAELFGTVTDPPTDTSAFSQDATARIRELEGELDAARNKCIQQKSRNDVVIATLKRRIAELESAREPAPLPLPDIKPGDPAEVANIRAQLKALRAEAHRLAKNRDAASEARIDAIRQIVQGLSARLFDLS